MLYKDIMSRSRAWVFTWNNYDEDNVKSLKDITDKVKYLIFGKEIAPKTGTPHLQGYIVWKQQKTMSACVKALGSKAIHVEIAKGTSAQNKTYSSKEGDVTRKQSPRATR